MTPSRPNRDDATRRRGLVLAAAVIVDRRRRAAPATRRGTTDAAVGEARSGGSATVFNESANAFALGIPTLDRADRRAFAVGNSFFNDNWVTAPASTEGRDGLGPLFNAQSCSSCHFHDGRAQPPRAPTTRTRAPVPAERAGQAAARRRRCPIRSTAASSRTARSPACRPRATVRITNREVPGRFADGTQYTLLAPTYEIVDPAYGPLARDVHAVAAHRARGVRRRAARGGPRTTRSSATPTPTTRTATASRAGRTACWDVRTERPALGRFGWKANVPTVEQQNAGAFNGDIGITSSLFPTSVHRRAKPRAWLLRRAAIPRSTTTSSVGSPSTRARSRCPRAAQVEGSRGAATASSSSAKPRARRATSRPCAPATPTSRRSPTRRSTRSPTCCSTTWARASADGRPDGLASGSEWRTAPLWGIGLVETVNGHTRFLHDGRARNLTEAILWHGGEAEAGEGAVPPHVARRPRRADRLPGVAVKARRLCAC